MKEKEASKFSSNGKGSGHIFGELSQQENQEELPVGGVARRLWKQDAGNFHEALLYSLLRVSPLIRRAKMIAPAIEGE